MGSLIFKPIAWANVRVASGTGMLKGDVYNGQTIDDVVLATNDRVLLAGQTNKAENGIWIAGASFNGAMRATDADAASEFEAGKQVSVTAGTLFAGKTFECILVPVAVGTDPIAFRNPVQEPLTDSRIPAFDNTAPTGKTPVNAAAFDNTAPTAKTP